MSEEGISLRDQRLLLSAVLFGVRLFRFERYPLPPSDPAVADALRELMAAEAARDASALIAAVDAAAP